MPKVKIGDINMYYEIDGEGKPLVLIPGGPGRMGWAPQIREFSQKYQVISFDNRGEGQTDAPNHPYSTEMMVEDTAGLLDTLGVDKVHLAGFCHGGAIAQNFTLKYPQQVKSLILFATVAKMTGLMRHVSDVWYRLMQPGLDQETRFREQLSWVFTDKFFESEEQIQASVNMSVSNPYPQTSYAWVCQGAFYKEHDTRERLGEISAPTLVIVGKEDIVTPVKCSEELARGIPNAELIILDGGGHMVNVENAAEFNQAVLGFLAEVEKGEKGTNPQKGIE